MTPSPSQQGLNRYAMAHLEYAASVVPTSKSMPYSTSTTAVTGAVSIIAVRPVNCLARISMAVPLMMDGLLR